MLKILNFQCTKKKHNKIKAIDLTVVLLHVHDIFWNLKHYDIQININISKCSLLNQINLLLFSCSCKISYFLDFWERL